MSLLSTKDLTRLTGIAAKQFYIYRQREKLIRDPSSKLYNDQNPINHIFLIEHAKNTIEIPMLKLPKKINEQKAGPAQELLNFNAIETEQKQLQLEKLKKEIEEKEIKINHLNGSLISLDKTIVIVKSYSENMQRELLQNMRTFITDICVRHSIDPGKTGEYKLHATNLINKSNKLSIEKLLKQFVSE